MGEKIRNQDQIVLTYVDVKVYTSGSSFPIQNIVVKDAEWIAG